MTSHSPLDDEGSRHRSLANFVGPIEDTPPTGNGGSDTPQTFTINLDMPALLRSEVDTSTPTAVYTNQLAVVDTINQTILSVGMIMNFAALLFAVVGGIGLLALAMISVYEQQREIGIMRSLGAQTQTVMRQFLLEGMLVGVAAWVVSLPLSYALAQILVRAAPFRDVVATQYPFWIPLMGLLGILGITGLATCYPALVAGRLTIARILHYL